MIPSLPRGQMIRADKRLFIWYIFYKSIIWMKTFTAMSNICTLYFNNYFLRIFVLNKINWNKIYVWTSLTPILCLSAVGGPAQGAFVWAVPAVEARERPRVPEAGFGWIPAWQWDQWVPFWSASEASRTCANALLIHICWQLTALLPPQRS